MQEVRTGVQSRDAKFAFVVRDDRVASILILEEALVPRNAKIHADFETFQRLAIFIGDLTGNDAFGNELKSGGRGVGSKLERNATGYEAQAFLTEEAGLFCCESDAASRKTFKLKLAFGVGERGTRGGARQLNEGMRNRLAGHGIHDGTLKGARTG